MLGMATYLGTSALGVVALILGMAPCTHAYTCIVPPLLAVPVCTLGFSDILSLSKPLRLEAWPLSYYLIEDDMCQSTSLEHMETVARANHQKMKFPEYYSLLSRNLTAHRDEKASAPPEHTIIPSVECLSDQK